MNAEDLVSCVNAGISGWLKDTKPDETPSLARAVHTALVEAVASPRPSSRPRHAPRQIVIAVINELSNKTLTTAAATIAQLRSMSCLFVDEFTEEDGTLHRDILAFDDLPTNVCGHEVLHLAMGAQALSAAQQCLVMRAFAADADLSETRIHLQFATEDEDLPKVAKLAKELADRSKAYARLCREMNTPAKQWYAGCDPTFAPFEWHRWAMPVQVPLRMADDQLLVVARWYRTVGSAMYQPLPLGRGGSARHQVAWRRAWATYEDCGDAFTVIAAWLECLASIDETRRCEICYRHVGRETRKFCALHVRRASQRQSARDLHVSPLYKALLGRFVETTPAVGALVRGAINFDVPSTTRAQEKELPTELRRPSISLGGALDALEPVFTSALQSNVNSHYLRLLEIASTPFRCEVFRSALESVENRRQRREAEKWLSWTTFFQTWFASAQSVEFAPGLMIGRGLDVDHPLAAKSVVLPRKLAMDIAHLRCWCVVDQYFDDYAYVNLAAITALRKCSSATGAPATLAEIAREIGASKEAVRETLQYANDSRVGRPRRQRMLPGSIDRLASVLNLDASVMATKKGVRRRRRDG